jgi:hypothetical protein
MFGFFERKPAIKTVNVGKVEIHFHFYDGTKFSKTIYGEYREMGEFSYVDTAKYKAQILKEEYKKSNKIAIGSDILIDTREIKKITFDPQVTHPFTFTE